MQDEEPLALLDKTSQRTRSTRWGGCIFAGILLGALLLLSINYTLRSEWFLRMCIDPQLEKVGARLGGKFQYQDVHTVGFSQIVIDGLVLVPDKTPKHPNSLQIQTLSIHPNFRALLDGKLEIRRVRLSGLSVDLWINSRSTADGQEAWVERLLTRFEKRLDSDQKSSEKDPQRDLFSFRKILPKISVEYSHISLRSPTKGEAVAEIELQSLTLSKVSDGLRIQGNIAVEGFGETLFWGDFNRSKGIASIFLSAQMNLNWRPFSQRVAEHLGGELGEDLTEMLQHLKSRIGAESQFAFESVEVQWPPKILIKNLHLSEMTIKAPKTTLLLESIEVDEFSVSWSQKHALIRISPSVASFVDTSDSVAFPSALEIPSVSLDLDAAGLQIDLQMEPLLQGQGSLEISGRFSWKGKRRWSLEIKPQDFEITPLAKILSFSQSLHIGGGRISGLLSLQSSLEASLLQADISVTLQDASLQVSALSAYPLEEIDLQVDLSLEIDRAKQRLKLLPGKIVLGALPFSIKGEVVGGEGENLLIDVEVEGKDLPAKELLGSLPKGFFQTLEGYELDGIFSAHLGLKLDTQNPAQLELLSDVDFEKVEVLKHNDRANIPLLKGEYFAFRISTSKQKRLIGPKQPNWVPHAEIPKYLLAALVTAEDDRFYIHRGFDLRAIRNSLIANLRAKRIVRGGSTITQQLAKNLFLNRDKTLDRKLQEALLAWQMEEHLSKERILELYFNMLHWGVNVYGLEEATEFYFAKPPSKLTLREAVFLACILPNPVRFGRQYLRGEIADDRVKKMGSVLTGLLNRRVVSREEYPEQLRLIKMRQISSQPRPSTTQKTLNVPN